jgi:hypothetical protein
MTPVAKSGRFHPRSLDAINFPFSDMRGALGPYLNVFLVTRPVRVVGFQSAPTI